MLVRSIVELSGPAVLLFGRLIVRLFGCVGSVFFNIVYSSISHYAISFFVFFSTSCRFTVIFTFVPCVFYRSRFPFVRVISLFDFNVMVGERWVGLVSGLSVTRTYNLLGLGSYLR